MLFSSLLGLQQKVNSSTLKLVGNLSLIYKANFWLSVSFLMALFSILGIPPLSGFFSKLLVLVAGINEGYWLVAGLFIITSVVSSVYYLRLIKSLVFSQKSKSWALFFSVKKHFSFIVSLFLMFNLLFILVGNSFLQLVYGLVYDYSMTDIFYIDSLRSGLQRIVDQAIIDTNLFFNDGRQIFRIPLKWYEIIKASMPFRRSAAEDLAERAEACKQFLHLMEGLANTPVITGQKMSEFNKELLHLIILDDCRGLGYEMRYEDSMRIKNNIKWLLELNYPPKAIRAVLLKAEWGIKGPGFSGPARFILVVNK
jgi:hypothetical protein